MNLKAKLVRIKESHRDGYNIEGEYRHVLNHDCQDRENSSVMECVGTRGCLYIVVVPGTTMRHDFDQVVYDQVDILEEGPELKPINFRS